MNIKNAVIIILVMVVQIICLGLYTNYVLVDVLTASIKQETTKVINTNNNDLKTKIDNNFKKIDELNSTVSTAIPIKPSQENTLNQKPNSEIKQLIDNDCPVHYIKIRKRRMTERQLSNINNYQSAGGSWYWIPIVELTQKQKVRKGVY